ncbi:HAMP domain-containing protein [Epibacterium sp. SM1979]|uniref:HAMP domain-containing protein n=1 Tax=Tritonibacter litoralis TaxID=2662264 RepID=A0A843YKR0_9RHOB|nr:HAMP domain-containing protein [Tritonibacter litoralis]
MGFSARSLMFKFAAPVPMLILACVIAGFFVVPKLIEQTVIAQATTTTLQSAHQIRTLLGDSDTLSSDDLELFDGSFSISVHSQQEITANPALVALRDAISLSKTGYVSQYSQIDQIHKLRILLPVSPTQADGAMIDVSRQIDDAIAAAARLAWVFLAGLAALGATALASSVLTARSVVRSVEAICADVNEMASGNLDLEIATAERADEIGKVGRALISLQADLSKAQQAEGARSELQEQQAFVVSRLREGLNAMAKGDLTVVISETFPEDHEQLRRDYNRTVETLSETMHEIVETSNNIRNGASEISAASDDLAMRTESQAATLEETSAALDELTGSVRTAAEGARDVETTMGDAHSVAQSSDNVVKRAVDAMNEISDSSNQIAKIITVIDDIAFQTNLLALNAGIEAARAGEAGRGFAVVAAEVRALAQRSSDAAMEIKDQIGNSGEQVENGVRLVGESGGALSAVVGQVSHISDLISGIAQAAERQSTGLNEINVGVLQLDQVTQQNAAMVEESTAASHLLKNEAAKLAELVAHFDIERRSNGEIFLFDLDAPEEEVPDVPPVPQTSAKIAQLAAGGGASREWQDF